MDQGRSDIEDAIARDREQIASTLEALEHKADLKARLQERAEDVKERMLGAAPPSARPPAERALRVVRERPAPFVAAGIFMLGVWVGRRRAEVG